VLVALYFGVDPSIILNQMPTTGSPPSVEQSAGKPAGQDEEARFVSVVLADTEDTWRENLPTGRANLPGTQAGPLFGAVQSACGFAQAAMGPFYARWTKQFTLILSSTAIQGAVQGAGRLCPGLRHRPRGRASRAEQLGIMQKVQEMRSRVDEVRSNDLSVRTELQADCFAGLWAYHADKSRISSESGDIDEALNAASSIGDDRIQKQTRGKSFRLFHSRKLGGSGFDGSSGESRRAISHSATASTPETRNTGTQNIPWRTGEDIS